MATDPDPIAQTPPPGTDPLAPPLVAPVPPKVTKTGKPKGTNYFCLEAAHPGTAGSIRADLWEASRHFSSDEGGAPTCPGCGRPVSALVVEDPDQLPPSIQLIKDRLEIAERNR